MQQRSEAKQLSRKEEHAKKLFKIIEDDQELKDIIKGEVEDYRFELLEELYEKLEPKSKEVFDAKVRIFKKQVVKETMDELEVDFPAPKEDRFELDFDEYNQTEIPSHKKEDEEFKLEMP